MTIKQLKESLLQEIQTEKGVKDRVEVTNLNKGKEKELQ